MRRSAGRPRVSLRVSTVLPILALLGGPFVGGAEAQTCLPPPPGLVSWWPGDGDPSDIAGNNHGTLMGDATYARGMVGDAFSFDGQNDYVFIGNPPDLQLQDFTIDAWIQLDTLTEIPAAASILGLDS